MSYFENGQPVQTVDFPYDEIDGNPKLSELCRDDVEIMAKLFGLLLTYGGINSDQFFITANVLAYTLGFHPCQSSSGESIAAGLHMEKAAWFRRVNQMRKILIERKSVLPKIAGEWSKTARKSIKNKTTKTHETRKNRIRKSSSTHLAIYCAAIAAARSGD